MSSNPNIDGLLTGPGPEIEAHLVEWSKTPLPEYAGTYAVVLDHVLTVAECAALSRAAEAASPDGWERALINVGMGMQELMPESRNCDRIVWDDAEIAARIWKRVAEYVPELHALEGCPGVTGTGPSKRGETWRMTRLNERMRFLRYGPGEYFRGHCDGCYVTPDGLERSYFTLHLYLNEDGPDNRLVGGATAFHSWNLQREYKVAPKFGRVLIFQHRDLCHSGEEVLQGMKLTMRTDLMFKKVDPEAKG